MLLFSLTHEYTREAEMLVEENEVHENQAIRVKYPTEVIHILYRVATSLSIPFYGQLERLTD